VCAQCHSESFPKPGADQGPFIAGRTHDEHFMARAPLNLYKVTAERGIVRPHVAGAFWPDGTARVAGREYTAMMMSRCHTEGSMQCLSCHSMHDAPRDKQVHVRRSGDAGCLQCHADIGRDIPAHTHHAPGSSGSECLNCHMPRVTYGLLGARRNHRVDSPRVLAGSNARPVACNLCHLDRSLAWSAQFLQRWYGVPHPALPDEHREVAAAVLWALRGDAAQRAITAWHLGWPPARAVSGDDWLAPVLAHLLDDPYAAVRYIAGRSLFGRGRDGERGYDFVASPEARRAAARRVLDEWRARPGRVARPSVLIGAGGALDDERFASLAADRDDSPLGISE
jgi:predicted CXXCH cytochrome family protein